MGGTGGGLVYNIEEFRTIVQRGLAASPEVHGERHLTAGRGAQPARDALGEGAQAAWSAGRAMTLEQLADRVSAAIWNLHPGWAVAAGKHEYDGQVPDLSAGAIEAGLERLGRLQGQLEGLGGLTDSQELDRTALLRVIDRERGYEEAGSQWRRDPARYLEPLDVSVYLERDYAPAGLRLERAASQLRQNPGKSITAIALDCGFGGSAAFARAFRAGFGMSASEWRAAGRKDRETVRKDGEERQPQDGYVDDGAAAQRAGGGKPRRMPMSTNPSSLPVKPADSVRIETIEPFTVAYVRHVGPYAGDSALFGRLFGRLCRWAGPRGLLGPDAGFLTIYHDNPDITPGDKLRISVCVTAPAGTKPEGEAGVMGVEGGRYAVATFLLDPSEYGAAWNWLMGTWFPSSGYQPDDRPCFEKYLNDPEKHPRKLHHVEIWEPVRPL